MPVAKLLSAADDFDGVARVVGEHDYAALLLGDHRAYRGCGEHIGRVLVLRDRPPHRVGHTRSRRSDLVTLDDMAVLEHLGASAPCGQLAHSHVFGHAETLPLSDRARRAPAVRGPRPDAPRAPGTASTTRSRDRAP